MLAGIDIGGTKVAVGVFESGRLVDQTEIKTGEFEPTVASICQWLATRKIDAIGIGCAGPLDEKAGTVKNISSLPSWFDKPLVQTIQSTLGTPVDMVNDADAALLGELSNGVLKDRPNEPAVLLTFGTGVGGAFWDGRRLLKGHNSEHPEIGHVVVASDGPLCFCGLRGCLEEETSGSAMNRRAQEAGFKDFADMVANGDPNPVFEVTKARIDTGLRVYAHAFRPASIVLGGGQISRYCDQLVPYSELTSKEAPMLAAPIRIERAALGNQAGIYGGAALALSLVPS